MYVREPEEHQREQRRPPEPAALSLHAILALQRSAGNQAVGRLLARQLVKTARRKTLVAGSKGGKRVGEARLLYIYNELRKELIPIPAEYDTVKDGRKGLIAGGIIDDSDVAFFSQETGVTATADTGPSREDQLKEKIAADRGAIKSKYSKHIFQGEFDDDQKPTGFHHKGQSKTHQAYGAATPVGGDIAGVYQQSVRTLKKPYKQKGKQSTFFPDKVSSDDILDAITTVHGPSLRYQTVQYPASLKGMVLDKLGDATVYPAGGSNLDYQEKDKDKD